MQAYPHTVPHQFFQSCANFLKHGSTCTEGSGEGATRGTWAAVVPAAERCSAGNKVDLPLSCSHSEPGTGEVTCWPAERFDGTFACRRRSRPGGGKSAANQDRRPHKRGALRCLWPLILTSPTPSEAQEAGGEDWTVSLTLQKLILNSSLAICSSVKRRLAAEDGPSPMSPAGRPQRRLEVGQAQSRHAYASLRCV